MNVMVSIWLLSLVEICVHSLKIKSTLRPCGPARHQLHAKDELKICKNELDITLKIASSFKDTGFSHFVKVESVFDEEKAEEIELLNKLLIKVESTPPFLVYPLKFMKTVNSRPYEAFFHKENIKNFQGCRDFLTFENCAEYDRNGVLMPFSEGFCCPCHGNVERYHSRGGQDCADTHTPIGQETEAYHSSIHCLKFDQVWYSVNILEEPFIQQEVTLQIFREESVRDGWRFRPMFGSRDLLLSSHNTQAVSEEGQVIVDYVSGLHSTIDRLQYKDNVLLIPEPLPEMISDNLPLILKGNASEFLVVSKTFVSEGDTCDKVGVSFEAFMKHQNKCSIPAQSCLGNQPMDLWLHDVERHLLGKNPKYFLSAYATVHDNPIKENSAGKWFLQLRHPDSQIAHIHITIGADQLQPLFTKMEVYIMEITIRNRGNLTSVFVHLYNSAMITAKLHIVIRQCTINVQVLGRKKHAVVLGPKLSVVRLITVSTWSNSNDSVFCTVSLQDTNGSYIDQRNITLKKGESCSCQANCECWCGMPERPVCNSFVGHHFPFLHRPVFQRKRSLDRQLLVSLTVAFGLLMIGIIKSLFGLFEPICFGQFGWCFFTKGKPLDAYYEKDLRGFRVMYDKTNTPIHPRTGQTVQMMSTRKLFLMNLFFGFYLPLIWLHFLISYWRSSSKSAHCRSDDGRRKAGVSLGETFSSSISDLSRARHDLTVTTFRKQRKQMQQSRSEASYFDENLPILQPEPVIYTKTKMKFSRQSTENMVKELLNAKTVYRNFTKEAEHLQNSGDHFSMCGRLTKEGRKYKFDVHSFMKQTFENRGGPRRLARPKPILYPEMFTVYLTLGEVHTVISLHPMYPCLNEVLRENHSLNK